MSYHTPHVVLIALVTTVVSVGCGESVEPTPDGSLQVSWEVSPRGCDQSEVEKVQVDLDYEQGVVTETYPCQKGEATIGHLTPANYTLKMWGLDGDGNTVFGSSSREITVHGGEKTTASRMRLTARPGELRVLWRLKDGVPCGRENIDSVDLVLYDMQDTLIREQSADCTEGEALMEDVPPGAYQIEVRDASGESGYAALEQVGIERGKSTRVDVVLSPRQE